MNAQRLLCFFDGGKRMISQEEAKRVKQLIQKSLPHLKIDKVGFTHAGTFKGLEERLKHQIEKGHSSGFEHPIVEERVHPQLIFEGAQSILSIALAYPSHFNTPKNTDREDRRGAFARASWGEDYHHILRRRMDSLIEMIQIEIPSARFKPMVDTGELVDVAVAERAGLGFVGRNGLLITPEFGSFVYLGEIITNIPFESDPLVPFGCGDCYRCIQSCPTQALLGDGRMNAQRCLSYQTQTKHSLEEEYRRKIGHVIYGCDICQLTCPYNKGKDFHHHPEMEPDYEQVMPSLKRILPMTNKEFKREFGYLAGSWRGRKPIQRNAIIALSNYRDRSSLPLLIEMVEKDPRPVIRSTAAYAISIIQRELNPVLIQWLHKQIEEETDQEVIQEMKRALDRLENKGPVKERRELL